MALRLLEDSNHYVAPQDVYNLLLLGHHVRRTDWAKHVLTFLGWRLVPLNRSVAAQFTTCAISAAGQLVCFGQRGNELPQDLGHVVAAAAGIRHTCAVKTSGELVCFGDNRHGQCDVPPDLGPVVAVAAGGGHTCAVKTNGELVCFGENILGQCDLPPDLGPVVAVSAGLVQAYAVKPSGELVCLTHDRDVPAGFKVLLAPPWSNLTPTPNPAREVLQDVHHDEPPANIPEAEGAAIVAEQEASWIEHNIGSGWHSAGLHSQQLDGCTRATKVVHLKLSRSHRQLDIDLERSPALRPCRQALQEEGMDWCLQPSGAKIFMEPSCFRAIRPHLSRMRLRPCDLFVAANLEEEVVRVICSLPYSLGVRPRSSRDIAFAHSDGEVALVSLSFLNIPATTLLNPSSATQSTTEARTHQGYHGTNPRRFQAQWSHSVS